MSKKDEAKQRARYTLESNWRLLGWRRRGRRRRNGADTGRAQAAVRVAT